MKTAYVCRVVVNLDVRAVDKADAYETLQAWADAVRDGDADGIRTLQEYQVLRARPTFDLKDIQELHKPPPEPRGSEPPTIIDPTATSLRFGFSIERTRP